MNELHRSCAAALVRPAIFVVLAMRTHVGQHPCPVLLDGDCTGCELDEQIDRSWRWLLAFQHAAGDRVAHRKPVGWWQPAATRIDVGPHCRQVAIQALPSGSPPWPPPGLPSSSTIRTPVSPAPFVFLTLLYPGPPVTSTAASLLSIAAFGCCLPASPCQPYASYLSPSPQKRLAHLHILCKHWFSTPAVC